MAGTNTTLVLMAWVVAWAALASDGSAQPGAGQARHRVQLGCTDPGTGQEQAKEPGIRNTTTATVPAGTRVEWAATDGDRGLVVLREALGPGGLVRASGKPGRQYECSASFDAGDPDLVVSRVAAGDSTLTAEVANLNPWVGAGKSTAKLVIQRCGASAPTRTLLASVPAIAAGGRRQVTFAAEIPSRHYYVVTADSGEVVTESDEGNNALNGQERCRP